MNPRKPLNEAAIRKNLEKILAAHALWLATRDLASEERQGERADLTEANLQGADLSKANLRDANLQGSNLSEADLRDIDLSGADLWAVNFIEADLSGANLRKAMLHGAIFWGANITEADLTGADLSMAKVTSKKLMTIKGTPAIMPDGKPPAKPANPQPFIRDV
jgi:uncharacterized protein YjbI with pentapeptide repeats